MTREVLQDGETFGIIRGKINANFLELYSDQLTPSDVLLRTNNNPFTPTNPYNPATKLYADNLITNWKAIYDPNNINSNVFNRSNHIGDMNAVYITQDADHRFVSDTEKSVWNGKEDAIGSKGTAFNKDFGTIAGTASEGNHNHSNDYEPKNVNIQSHISTTSGNPHSVTKADLNIENINNTSDLNKPISTETQTALDLKSDKTYVDDELALKRALTDGKFGDVSGGDYLEVKSDGSVELYGNARVLKTVEIDINGVELHPTQSPTWVNYRGSRIIEFSGTALNTIYFVAKMPRNYDEGTDISFQLHGVFPAGSTGDRQWEFTYSWTNIGALCPTETLVEKTFTGTQTANVHAVGDFGSMSGVGKETRSVLLCSLTRRGDIDASNESTYLMFASFNYIVNKYGDSIA